MDFIKHELQPSSPLFVFLCAATAAGWITLRPSSRRAPRFLRVIVLGYWLLSTRAGPALLTAPLSAGFEPVHTRQETRNANVIVVLSGGGRSYREAGVTIGVPTRSTVLRGLEAARVFRLVAPRHVIASGGAVSPKIDLTPESELLRDVLVGAGVPLDRIVQEPASRSTRDQARLVAAMLTREGERTFVLVTSPAHMRRSVAVFRAYALDPVPSPAPIDSDQMPPPSWLVPNSEALYRSDAAVYEYAALIYYWSRGLFSSRT
jgi:uncharacterized SAM-binding protein YcdF (DUF218 family)